LAVPEARQGDVWDVDLEPVQGREQAGTARPCVVVSVDAFGTGPTDLAVVVPVTTKHKTRLDVQIDPPEGGLSEVSYAMPYQVRTLSRARLVIKRGSVRDGTLVEIIRRVRIVIRPPD
jgi:mRNA-degrading endonuclease toxin of MazEF toxin-antitoxin module